LTRLVYNDRTTTNQLLIKVDLFFVDLLMLMRLKVTGGKGCWLALATDQHMVYLKLFIGFDSNP
jgi:hypothetical protein